MDDKQIDKLFQSGLNDFPVEFNDAHWEEMALLLAKKKKRRGFFFWLFCAGLFSFVAVHAVWTFMKVSEQEFVSAEGYSNENSQEKFYVKAERSFDYPFLPIEVEGAYVSGGFGAMRAEVSNSIEASNEHASAGLNKQAPAPNDEDRTPKAKQLISPQGGTPENDEVSSVSVQRELQHTMDESQLLSDTENEGSALAGTSGDNLNALKEAGIEFLSPLDPYLPNVELDRSLTLLDPLESVSRNKKYISIFFGPDLHLSNKNSSDQLPSTSMVRSEQEDNAMRFRIGLNAGVEIKKLDLNLGAELAVLGETTYYSDFTVTDSVLVDNSYYEYEDVSYWSYDSIFDGNNWTYVDSLFINAIDSTLIEYFSLEGVEREYNLSVKNGPVKHYLLNFPVSVGYRTRIGNVGLTIRQGVNIGLLTRSTGYIITSNGKDLISVRDPELQRRTLLLSSITSLRFQYFLREELALNVIPRVDIPFQSVFKNSDYDRKYTSFSVSFGLSYYFR